jgi:hypothetical protein
VQGFLAKAELREELSRTKRLRPSLGNWFGSLMQVSRCTWERVGKSDNPDALRRGSIALMREPSWQEMVLDASKGPSWAIRFMSSFAGKDQLLALLPMPFDHLLVDRAVLLSVRRANAWMARVLVTMLDHPELRRTVLEEPSAGRWLDYYDDWSIPREVRQTLFHLDFASVSVLALFGAMFEQTDVPGWMPSAAYGDLVQASRRWLDLTATAFGVPVPDEAREHLDWAGIERNHLEWRAAREQSVRAFEEGGRVMRAVLPLPDPSGQAE